MADIRVENQGAVAVIQPLNPIATAWLTNPENVAAEGWQWMGGGLCVEPRQVDGLVELMVDDGLEVE